MPVLSDRVGTFTDSVIRRMTRINNQYDSINLSQGFPDFDPPKQLMDALAETAYKGPHQYAVTFGAQNFREALAKKTSPALHHEVDPNTEICVTCGGTEAMMAAMMTICNPGDKVMIFSPFYENYGADAVYCSLPEFGMRSAPANFTPEQLTEGVIYAHARGRKVYLTMNTLPTNEEADRLPDAIKEAAKAGVDAFIVADLGVLDACKTVAPDIDVHMSTQTGITNWAAARAAYNLGAKRVVLAREMSLQDIAILRDKTPPELEIEAFVHGAMCMSVSGRCLLSNYMAGRDANRGQCAQPCRWKYYLSEETRPGQLYEIGENENGSYILNANDLCTAPFIDLICKAGVDSLKIEGRAKTFYYVASVTAAYRKALDAYLADPANDNFELPAEVYEELTRTSHRHYSPGFYFGREQAKQATDSATYIREWEFVGTVDRWENGVAHCQQRGKWSLGDTLEALCPDGRSIPLTPEWIENEAGERVDSTPHAMEKYTMPTPELPPMSLLRRKTAE